MSDSLTGAANAAPSATNFPESRCFVAIASLIFKSPVPRVRIKADANEQR